MAIHSSKTVAAWWATAAVRIATRKKGGTFINTGMEICRGKILLKTLAIEEQDATIPWSPTQFLITSRGYIEDLSTGWVSKRQAWDQNWISFLFRVQTCYQRFYASSKNSITRHSKLLSMLCDAGSTSWRKTCNHDVSQLMTNSFMFNIFLLLFCGKQNLWDHST